MNDTVKTVIFVAVAAVAAVAALASRPSTDIRSQTAAGVRDQALCPELKKILDVADIEIAKYDETHGDVSMIQVVREETKGQRRWIIPSHDGYPADSKTRVADVPVSLMGLKIIEMVSDDIGSQEKYGVIDPDPKSLQTGATGVGTRVVLRDKAEGGRMLLGLIIGKEVEKQPTLHYVRKIGELPTYIVDVKTDKLSTSFEDWIEPNLLAINLLKMKQLYIDDYSIKKTEEGVALVMRSRTALGYNDASDKKWKLVTNQKYSAAAKTAHGDPWVDVPMTADEELDTTKLDDLRTALGDLKIVDVSRKPKELGKNLQILGNLSQEEAAQLAMRGFYVGRLTNDGPVELCSGDGEFHVVMDDGAEYVLRFGEITGATAKKADAEKAKDGKSKAGKADDKKGDGLNRYLLVTARFNPEGVAKPKFLPMPEMPKENAAAKPDEKSAKDAAKDKAAKPVKPEEKTVAAKDEKSSDKKDGKAEAKKPLTAKEKYEAEKALVEKENKRLQEEYEQQLTDGKKHVEELNERFADWYYVIPGDVFSKIHLGRTDIITKKKAPKDKKAAVGEAHDHDHVHSHE